MDVLCDAASRMDAAVIGPAMRQVAEAALATQYACHGSEGHHPAADTRAVAGVVCSEATALSVASSLAQLGCSQ